MLLEKTIYIKNTDNKWYPSGTITIICSGINAYTDVIDYEVDFPGPNKPVRGDGLVKVFAGNQVFVIGANLTEIRQAIQAS